MAVAIVAAAINVGALAAPYTPADCRRAGTASRGAGSALAELKRMRMALRANRTISTARLALRGAAGRRARDRDPRFLGQAQAALAPWWAAADPPPAALLLRATVTEPTPFRGVGGSRSLAGSACGRRSGIADACHHFDGWRYADAQRDCTQAARLASGRVTTMCLAGASA
jgi:hypothetical protein